MDLFYTKKRSLNPFAESEQNGTYRISGGGDRMTLERFFVQLSEENLGEENQDLQAMLALRRLIMLRRRESGAGNQAANAISSIFVPIQPPPQQNQQQPNQQQNQQPNQGQQEAQQIQQKQ